VTRADDKGKGKGAEMRAETRGVQARRAKARRTEMRMAKGRAKGRTAETRTANEEGRGKEGRDEGKGNDEGKTRAEMRRALTCILVSHTHIYALGDSLHS
jgi:hypothetical protein